MDHRNQDYHLRSAHGRWNGSAWVLDAETSPAIDAGDPKSESANETAPGACRINMGAYGNTPQASRGINDAVAGDLNDDCKGTIVDLIWVRNKLNKDPADPAHAVADVNNDGVINIIDLIWVRNKMRR